MEDVARQALAAAHPGREFETLDLVLVDDRPGRDRGPRELRGLGWRRARARRTQSRGVRLGRREGRLGGTAVAAPARELVPGFEAEDEREDSLSRDPLLLEGWAWGSPRKGHPEGAVGNHVADLLRQIDEWGETGARRRDLRFLALVHDSLKFSVQQWRRRTGENHHAMRARRLAERYTDDERLLATIEMHDRPYTIWRRMHRKGGTDEQPGQHLDRMLDRIPDRDLFLRFVELDGSTEGKNPEPIRWIRKELERRSAEA